MKRFVALLRAVNVGGTGKLPMADLRALAKEIGFLEVQTYIQSGNLIFASEASRDAIKDALETRLQAYAGKPVGIILRSGTEIQQVLESNPFVSAAPNKVGVIFLDRAPSWGGLADAKGLADEEVRIGRREVFVHYPSGMGRSKLRLPGMAQGTTRNINTVRKLVELACV